MLRFHGTCSLTVGRASATHGGTDETSVGGDADTAIGTGEAELDADGGVASVLPPKRRSRDNGYMLPPDSIRQTRECEHKQTKKQINAKTKNPNKHEEREKNTFYSFIGHIW